MGAPAVITVTDRLRVEPNHIYVIPPNAEMTIGDGALALTSRATVDRHMPIDHFFRSLAQELEGRAIGVVLSGTGSDGTLGLRAQSLGSVKSAVRQIVVQLGQRITARGGIEIFVL